MPETPSRAHEQRSTKSLRRALGALTEAAVDFTLRKPPAAGELDIHVGRRSVAAVEAALATTGFVKFRARGQRGHRFYLSCSEGDWGKVDVKLTPLLPRPPGRLGVAGRLTRLLAAIVSHVPLGVRRSGPVVAFIGPDGAGKGTVIDAVRATLPVACDVYYLGSKIAGAPVITARARQRLPLRVREPLFVVKKLIRSGRVLMHAYGRAWCGSIVLCDRHPLEALATRPRITAAARRLEHGLLLRVLPVPDLIVVLDAPTEILLARKSEHPAAVIDDWRAGYRDAFAAFDEAYFCSTDQSLEAVASAIRGQIWDALMVRRGRAPSGVSRDSR
jgi:thymidylate kinase